MKKIKVAYVCVHNSCRSQMAEAITNNKYKGFFEAYSGGTETKPQINQDAVKIINKLYSVDMNQTQSSKLIDSLGVIMCAPPEGIVKSELELIGGFTVIELSFLLGLQSIESRKSNLLPTLEV